MFEGILFEGGGIKALAFVGALDSLNKSQCIYEIETLAGTGTGALVATLLASSFSLDDIYKCLYNLDAFVKNKPKFMEKWFGCVSKPSKIVLRKGREFSIYIDNLLFEKFNIKNITFMELFKLTGKHLKLFASNVDGSCYYEMDHIHRPYMSVSVAIYICSCLSLLMLPIKIHNEYFIDGGLLDTAFLRNIYTSKRMLVIHIDDAISFDTNLIDKKDFVLSYFVSFLKNIYIKRKYKRFYWYENHLICKLRDPVLTKVSLITKYKYILYNVGFDNINNRLSMKRTVC